MICPDHLHAEEQADNEGPSRIALRADLIWGSTDRVTYHSIMTMCACHKLYVSFFVLTHPLMAAHCKITKPVKAKRSFCYSEICSNLPMTWKIILGLLGLLLICAVVVSWIVALTKIPEKGKFKGNCSIKVMLVQIKKLYKYHNN